MKTWIASRSIMPAMVFRTSFMQSAQAGWMGVPTIPLSELYSHAVGFIEAHGGQVSLRTSVDGFAYDEHSGRWRIGFEGGRIEADAVVLAVPFESMQKLFPLLPAHQLLPNRCRTDWNTFSIRRSRAFICGSIARLQIWITRFCSIPRSNGCTTRLGCSRSDVRKMPAAISNWW